MYDGAIWDTRSYCYRNIFFHGMKTKMGKDFPKFSDAEIKKQGIHFSKYVIYITKINTDKIIMPDKLPCTKMVQMHKDNVRVTQLCILFPKLNSYVKHF